MNWIITRKRRACKCVCGRLKSKLCVCFFSNGKMSVDFCLCLCYEDYYILHSKQTTQIKVSNYIWMRDNEWLILLKMCWNASQVALEPSLWVLDEWVASHQWANIMLIIACSRCWTLDAIPPFIWIDLKSSFLLFHSLPALLSLSPYLSFVALFRNDLSFYV